MTKEMICIVCPVGCRLKVDENKETGEYTISNNQCKRGPIYALKELTNPTRTITATIKIKNGIHKRLPVKTKDEIPKAMNYEVMKELEKLVVEAPVKNGQVLLENVCGLGIDVIATRDLPAQP